MFLFDIYAKLLNKINKFFRGFKKILKVYNYKKRTGEWK